MDITKQTTISKAIEEENLIFNFATDYYYDNSVTDLKTYRFSDADFNAFKAYLKGNNFSFETKTERAFSEALAIAKEENINNTIGSEYSQLVKAIDNYKSSTIDANKAQLKSLLTDEIIKRYYYSEGLYEYYTANNPEIKKAIEILNNPNEYINILN